MLGLKESNSYIIKAYKNGKSTNKIAQELDINPGTVWYTLKQNGIKIKPRQKFIGNIKDYEKKIVRLYENNNSASQIARKLQISLPTVIRVLKGNNCDTSLRRTFDPNNLLKHKLNKVIELYEKGHTCNDIGRILGHTGHQVMLLLKKNKYEIRDFRYKVDEHFFDKIDTWQKAYVLGWWMSDGTVSPDGRIRIQIQKEDSYILEEIAKIMQFDGPLYDVPPPKRFPWRKPQKVLGISRKILADKLIQLGCPPRKSLILKFPTSDIVPDNLLHHFVLGFFEGDGSTTIPKNRPNSLSVSFTSTDIFLNELKERVFIPLGIESKLYYRYKDKNSASLMINKKESVRKLYEYLYQDATLFLTRKRDKFLKGLNIESEIQ